MTGEEINHSPTGTENILLVEDNEQVRDLNHLILTRQGYDVQTAGDGTDALTTKVREVLDKS